MKPSFAVALFVLSLALAFPVSARADDPANPPTPPPAPPAAQPPADGTEPAPQHRHHMRPAYVLSDLTAKLSLTPDQQKQVGAFIDSGNNQAKQLRGDDSVSREDKRARMGAIMKATHDQIRAVLTADQQKQFDALPAHGGRGPDAN
jgi:hypothetical protein